MVKYSDIYQKIKKTCQSLLFKTTNALWVIFNMHLLQYFGNLYEHSICTCHVCRLRIFMGFIIIHCLSNVCRVGVTVVHVYLIESLPFSDSSATALLTRLRSPIQCSFILIFPNHFSSQLPPHPPVWKQQDQMKRSGSNNRNITRERNFTILNSLYGYGFRSATTVDLIKLQKGAKVPILV